VALRLRHHDHGGCVKAKTLAVLVLAVVLVVSTAVASGCVHSAAEVVDKVKLTAALSEFELSAGVMTQALAAGSDATVASLIKGAKADMKSKWQAVMSAAKDLDRPEEDAAEKAWRNVEHAIDALADNATVATANAALMPGLDGLMAIEAGLWNAVQTTE
jgi:hypothetical protein